MVDTLKAADCLDRYRLPLIGWWPDPRHLRVTVPGWLHAIAFDLMVHSERRRLAGATAQHAVADACLAVTRR